MLKVKEVYFVPIYLLPSAFYIFLFILIIFLSFQSAHVQNSLHFLPYKTCNYQFLSIFLIVHTNKKDCSKSPIYLIQCQNDSN